MPKRTYKKYGEVYLDLEKFCRKRLKSDSPYLPPERELAQTLGTSVMTLRKALERGQMDGLLIPKGRRLEISLPERTLYGFGKILFIEQGFYGKPVLGAINRLYQELALRMLALKADFEFYQLNGATDLKDFERACDRAAVLLTGVLTSDAELNHQVISILVKQEASKPVIALSDPNLGYFENHCALDNVAAGRKAGEILLAAGCRKPGFIGYNSSPIFTKRLRGMQEACRAAGVELCELHGRYGELPRAVLDSRCDGIFIVSDEGIGHLLHDLLAMDGLIPDRLKVLTLHGRGESLLCQPPVACLNHATDRVADGIIAYLLAKAGNPAQPPLRRLLAPRLYPSITLGKSFTIK
ncbi:MAG: substrate-binding domain-containing protein [Lentisphaeria bacterium]|nr:substrate-binding domain-containing protein [Lentisphaeria bacterium]